ncbi:hypothetical protein [Litorivivens sp.]|uniref:hypothetical protein n=1 Tax=Litorivivens sp. TaxID=2020868 RepID=UPI0035631A6E
MPEPITKADLERMERRGAKVEVHKKQVQVHGLEPVAAPIAEQVKSLEAIAEQIKGLAEKQPIDVREQLSALTKAVEGMRPRGDHKPFVAMKPVIEAIEALRAAIEKPRPAYKFTVEYNDRGRISTVMAVPQDEL